MQRVQNGKAKEDKEERVRDGIIKSEATAQLISECVADAFLASAAAARRTVELAGFYAGAAAELGSNVVLSNLDRARNFKNII
eukprot:COSAG05_NODE_1679_length_4291_cov_102.969704_6_plen_83_part_00